MSYQIDQSGKIEQTEKSTVLAAANGSFKAVIIPAREKRKLQELFRQHGRPQLFIDAVFTVGLHYLIAQLKTDEKIEIDTEYPGHTEIIEQMLYQLTNKKLTIRWVLVGKTSSAHDIAYKIYHKKLKLGKVLRFETIAKLAIKIAGGYLNSTTLRENRYSVPASKKILTQNRRKINKYRH